MKPFSEYLGREVERPVLIGREVVKPVLKCLLIKTSIMVLEDKFRRRVLLEENLREDLK